MELEIEYHINPKLTVDEFRTVLNASGLGERRPVDDPEAMVSMLQHANLIVAGRTSEQWVGVARTLTDYSFVAYMSDLAVDSRFQRSGIGRELIRRTRAELGPNCKIVLLAAPAAVEYYPRIGFQRHPQAWLLPADGDLA